MTDETPKRTRKVKPRMAHINIRIPAEIVEFYKLQDSKFTKKMREVLVAHATSTKSETLV